MKLPWPVYVGVVLLMMVTCTCSTKIYTERPPASQQELFPSCVEVVDVFPPPHSVVKATGGHHRLSFKVTFSRPVYIETEDTTAGLHPGLNEEFVSSWQPTAKSFLNVQKLSPIFLSHSQTTLHKTYSATRVTGWDGSDRIFLAMFDLAAEYTALQQFYLVIDGGRFYALDDFIGLGVQRTYAPLSIFGEFYFHLEDTGGRKPQPITPSPYCWKTPRKTYFISQETTMADPSLSEEEEEEEEGGGFAVELVDGSHRLESSHTGALTLHLSLLTRGAEGEASIKLPPSVTASYHGANVTVRVPSWTATYGNKASTPDIRVPVEKKLVFDLREQIYHSTGYKVATLPQKPAFAKPPSLPSFLKEGSSHQLPKIHLSHYSSGDGVFAANFELYEPVNGIKLAQYFPIVSRTFQHSLDNLRNHMSHLDGFKWATLSRTASIYSRPRGNSSNLQYQPHLTAAIERLESRRFEADNSKRCPQESRGNAGRRGRLEHVIEKGPFYHVLVPRSKQLWTSNATAVTNWASYVDENGEKTVLSKTSDTAENNNYIPRAVSEGLEKYVCLLEPVLPLEGLVGSSDDVYERWVPLDACIFVPRGLAGSSECGGLMLFTNVANITGDPDFCSKNLGDCVGLPFSSKQRFPSVLTYGVPELTGWFPCGPHCDRNLAKFSHPVGQHMLKRNQHFTLPRAALVQQTRHNHVAGAVIREKELYLRLLPLTHRRSETAHTLTITGHHISILEPVLANMEQVTASEGELFCDHAWNLEGQTLSLASTNKMETTLSATVHNTGEGGGTFVFEVKCSDQLLVSPGSSNISKWLPANGTAMVEYRLSGELVSREPIKRHLCEMDISVQPLALLPLSSSSSTAAPPPPEQRAHCTALVVTYYGAFDDPCKLPEPPLPNVAVQHWVLPKSQLKMELGLEDFLRAPVGNTLVFVRAVTIALDHPPEEIELLRVVHELEVQCLSKEITLVREDELLIEASRSRLDHAHRLSPAPLIFRSDVTSRKKVYFFASPAWADSQQHTATGGGGEGGAEGGGGGAEGGGGGGGGGDQVPMRADCSATVRASRPNWLCVQKLEEIAVARIPLGTGDFVASTEVEERRDVTEVVFAILTPIYGEQIHPVLLALLACVAATLVLLVCTTLGHGMMFALRKKMPKKETLKSINKDIAKMKRAEKKYWADPQVFLQPGPRGPYHVLHQFRATDTLDTRDIKSLKIIGMLRYKTKELQVMFGHVKKLFVDRGRGTTAVWLQASSGMYLLQRENVVEDYRVEFDAFLLSSGVKVKDSYAATPPPPPTPPPLSRNVEAASPNYVSDSRHRDDTSPIVSNGRTRDTSPNVSHGKDEKATAAAILRSSISKDEAASPSSSKSRGKERASKADSKKTKSKERKNKGDDEESEKKERKKQKKKKEGKSGEKTSKKKQSKHKK